MRSSVGQIGKLIATDKTKLSGRLSWVTSETFEADQVVVIQHFYICALQCSPNSMYHVPMCRLEHRYS